jgi:hypothetical protein
MGPVAPQWFLLLIQARLAARLDRAAPRTLQRPIRVPHAACNPVRFRIGACTNQPSPTPTALRMCSLEKMTSRALSGERRMLRA